MTELLNNYIDMPIDLLDARGRELSASLRNIDHCPERKEQIQHELGLISFELYSRYQEGKVEFASV